MDLSCGIFWNFYEARCGVCLDPTWRTLPEIVVVTKPLQSVRKSGDVQWNDPEVKENSDFTKKDADLPSGYDIHSSPWYRWPIEIDDFRS